jgi:hypothetical protein
MENKVELTFLRTDENTGNFLYKGTDGNIYMSIDGQMHDLTRQGEPLGPVYNTYIKTGEPIYNPEDRFGRNPGSKVQTESKKSLKQFIAEEIQKLHKITILKEEKKQIEEELKILNETKDVTAMYKKAGMEPPHPGKGIHTKKFHKCVTSVGKKGEVDNPYAVCMSSLGKEKAVKASLELMKK